MNSDDAVEKTAVRRRDKLSSSWLLCMGAFG